MPLRLERLKVNGCGGDIMISSKARKQTKDAKRKQVVDVACAFCGGKGRDPFGIMSSLATCQVCGGTGRRRLHQPMASCAYCHGTGVHPGSRLTCTTCGGVGTVQIPANAIPCPSCGGSGRSASCTDVAGSSLACTRCGGKGVVPAPRVPADLNARRVPELRELCAEFGLEDSGKKADLIERLRSAKAA